MSNIKKAERLTAKLYRKAEKENWPETINGQDWEDHIHNTVIEKIWGSVEAMNADMEGE